MKFQQVQLVHKQELLKAVIHTQERERSRIARNLHDEIGTNLTLSKIHIQQAMQQQGDLTFLSELKDQLGDVIKRSREISHELHPPILENFGLAKVLYSLINRIEKQTTLECYTKIAADFPRLRKEEETALYRVAQELLNNTVKHANASRVNLRLRMITSQKWQFTLKDDGIGFDLKNIEKGLGINNVEARLESINAQVFWKCNQGTSVTIVGQTDMD